MQIKVLLKRIFDTQLDRLDAFWNNITNNLLVNIVLCKIKF